MAGIHTKLLAKEIILKPDFPTFSQSWNLAMNLIDVTRQLVLKIHRRLEILHVDIIELSHLLTNSC